MRRLIFKWIFGIKPYGWQTIRSWALVDSRNMACHQLWGAYRWERWMAEQGYDKPAFHYDSTTRTLTFK